MDIELLNSERLSEWGGRLKFPSAAVDALQALASLVRGDEELRSIFTEFHQRTVLRGEWHRQWSALPVDERAQARLKDQTPLFYLLAYMSALPYTERRYRQLGIGMHIFHDTMKDFLFYLEDFHDLHGVWGYGQFAWIWRHLTCELFRLGRLQYMLETFHNGVKAFRRKTRAEENLWRSDRAHAPAAPNPDGHLAGLETVLLADPDQPLRTDGYAVGAGKSHRDPEGLSAAAWKPSYEETPAGWSGHLVNPYGSVCTHEVSLSRHEWELILQSGDTVLDLHIPRKDPLTVETCSHSFLQAGEFYARTFPDRPWKALYCHTWFFSPQLQTILPPDSSIVQFQREFYLYPFAGSAGFLWGFVFGDKYPDPATAPRDTSLRRAVLDWLAQGKEIFDLPGVMFHLPGAWGTQPYMGQWDERKTS
jgi:hypothetical protein